MCCYSRASGCVVPFWLRDAIVPVLAILFLAVHLVAANGQPIRLILDGTFETFDPPNADLEQFGFVDGDPIRFIADFDPNSPNGAAELIEIQLDGTTVFNLTDFAFGTYFQFNSSPGSGFEFTLFSGDTYRGTRSGVEVDFYSASGQQIIATLRSDQFPNATKLPAGLTFADLTAADSGFFALASEVFGIDNPQLFTVNYTDLGILVVPEPTTATLLVGPLGIVAMRRRHGGANLRGSRGDRHWPPTLG